MAKIKTKVVITDFKGFPMFTVRQVNKDGEIIEEIKPIVAVGTKKAQAIYDNKAEFEQFVKKNYKS